MSVFPLKGCGWTSHAVPTPSCARLRVSAPGCPGGGEFYPTEAVDWRQRDNAPMALGCSRSGVALRVSEPHSGQRAGVKDWGCFQVLHDFDHDDVHGDRRPIVEHYGVYAVPA